MSGIWILTALIFAVCMLGVGVGLLLKGKCISGSCGGQGVKLGNTTIDCAACQHHKPKPNKVSETEEVMVGASFQNPD